MTQQDPKAEQPQEPTPQPAADHAPTIEPTPQPAQQKADNSNPAPTPQPAPGQTVNRAKYERDMKKVTDELEETKAELEGYKGLKAEFDEWKSAQQKEQTEKALKAAGCHDVVSAAARLSEFDGDIEKLKEGAPHLFMSTDNSKSTGGNPIGTPDQEDTRSANMRKIMGLEDKKE